MHHLIIAFFLWLARSARDFRTFHDPRKTDEQKLAGMDPVVAHCATFCHRFALVRSFLPILGDALTFAPYLPYACFFHLQSRLVPTSLSHLVLYCPILSQWQYSSQRCCFWHCVFQSRYIVFAIARLEIAEVALIKTEYDT